MKRKYVDEYPTIDDIKNVIDKRDNKKEHLRLLGLERQYHKKVRYLDWSYYVLEYEGWTKETFNDLKEVIKESYR